MKRVIFAAILIFALTYASYPQSGTIRELTGEVEIKHASSSDFIPARSGNTVSQDTIISTGFRSTAII